MGGATRFMKLLTAPFSPIRPSIICLHRRLLTVSSPSKIRVPRLVNCIHSQSSNNSYTFQPADAQPQQQLHPWSEWNHFLNVLSNGQGFSSGGDCRIPPEDAFVVYEKLRDDFVRAAAACIAFARARPDLLGLLSRKDIEAVVLNGTPFLFKSALDTARRMRAFLGTKGSNVSEFDKATTVDLMKYILSYASNSITVSSKRTGLYSRELVDSSVRNLLHELGTACGGASTGDMPTSGPQFWVKEEQSLRPLQHNIEMRPGRWICPKCTFMNFVKNMNCLECDQRRPKKHLTDGEWECPECNFFNYRRNKVCLRCECKRPGFLVLNNGNSQSGADTDTNTTGLAVDTSRRSDSGHVLGNRFNVSEKTDLGITPQQNIGTGFSCPADADSRRDQTRKIDDETKSLAVGIRKKTGYEKWLKTIVKLHDIKDPTSSISDDEFPDIIPVRKGVNKFVVSNNTDGQFTPKYKREVAIDLANNSNNVPFVPFPPGYFTRKDTEQSSGHDSPIKAASTENERSNDSRNEMSVKNGTPRIHSSPAQSSLTSRTINNTSTDESSGTRSASGGASSQLRKDENAPSGWTGKSLEGSAVKEPDPLDMSEEAKAERWFKRVAQINDISELSKIPDEDFPSIMPMRKGINRFVVTKRKTPLERRLTSQQYRRNLPVVTNDSLKKENDES